MIRDWTTGFKMYFTWLFGQLIKQHARKVQGPEEVYSPLTKCKCGEEGC